MNVFGISDSKYYIRQPLWDEWCHVSHCPTNWRAFLFQPYATQFLCSTKWHLLKKQMKHVNIWMSLFIFLLFLCRLVAPSAWIGWRTWSFCVVMALVRCVAIECTSVRFVANRSRSASYFIKSNCAISVYWHLNDFNNNSFWNLYWELSIFILIIIILLELISEFCFFMRWF